MHTGYNSVRWRRRSRIWKPNSVSAAPSFERKRNLSRSPPSSLRSPPAALILKLANGPKRQMYWLTLLSEPATSFLPFCNEVEPEPIEVGQPETGTLAENEFVYYTVSLTMGEYKVILDFANAANKKTNIGGFLAMLDGDGGNHKELLYLNEIDTFSRKTGMFLVRKDAELIFRIYNRQHPVNYKLTIQPSEP
jgi:hypothetical protein